MDAVSPGFLSASAGDWTSYNGRHFTHRASTINGMSGAGVRNARQPEELVGIHIAGPDDYHLLTGKGTSDPAYL